MKRIFCLLALLSFTTHLYSQSQKDIIIVACAKGSLIIDGTTVATVDAEDASRQTLSYGEHYIQLKNDKEKYSLTVTIDDNTKGVLKIGCKTEAPANSKRIIDKEVSLSGALGSTVEENVFALDFEDEIVINCDILNKKGNATLFIRDYETGREIYRKDRFELITNEKLKIPSKGIYYFSLFTEALFGKTAKITIDRIPSPNSKPEFKTSVIVKRDTASTEVLNTTTRVFSSTNLNHSNRTTIKINLPTNTTYWTYWIGVGEEAKEKMDNFTATLIGGAARLLSANPLVLFGMKVIPALPSLNVPSTINYKFVSSKDAQLFLQNQPYSYYTFKFADNIATDYAIIKSNAPDLVLAMNNTSAMDGHNVNVRVVAFSVTSKYVMME
jgi:hypothetical protein